MSPSADPGQGAAPGSSRTPAAASGPAAPATKVPATPGPVAPVREPLVPERSREDTDAAWGDYPEPADDRLYRDRPPHWADF